MPPPDKFDWLVVGAILLIILAAAVVMALFQEVAPPAI